MDFKLLKRYIFILAVALALFAPGLYFADRLVTPAGETERFYDEPKDTVDVLIVGGSNIMCSVSPAAIYRQTGLTAYNLSTWSQPVWVSYYYIREALKYQSPKVVVLDMFGAFYDRSYLTGVDVDLVSDDWARLLKPSPNLVALNFARRRVQVTKKPWYEYLNIAKYHSRITELKKEDFLKIFSDDSDTRKGFGPMYTTESYPDYAPPAPAGDGSLYPYALEYLQKTFEMCEKEGIKLAILKAPHIASESDMALVERTAAMAKNRGVDVLDFCSANPIDFDYGTDMADHGHVNRYGSVKVTAGVTDYLKGLDLHPEHDEATLARWEEACLSEEDDFAKMLIKIAPDFDTFVERCVSHGNTALVMAKEEGAEGDRIEELFKGTVFEMSGEKIAENHLFFYDGSEVLTGEKAEEKCLEMGIEIKDDGSIMYRGEDYSYHRPGLNVAVFDFEKKEMYHRLSFDSLHGYTPYTR